MANSWLLTLALAAAASAQTTAPAGGAEAAPGTAPATGSASLDVHTEQGSRELFAACDGDADDRLDLFEACAAIDTLGDPLDPSSFRSLDSDRDGYLGWPEFDAHFRNVVDRGKPFRVRTCRRFVRTAPELQDARAATPLEVFLQLHDSDRDGGLDPDEIGKIAREIGLLPAFEAQLRMLDLDQSGKVEALELAPWFDKLRAVIKLPADPAPAPRSPLPPPWEAIDADGDGAIGVAELENALRRLDPNLARWARHLLRRLDGNGDERLEGKELPQPAPGSGPATGRADRAPAASDLLGLATPASRPER